MRYELWRFPGHPGHPAHLARSSAARVSHELRQSLRAAALSAAAHLAACGLRHPPDGWAILEAGAPADIVTPLPPRQRRIQSVKPLILRLPADIVAAIELSTSAAQAVELLAPLGATLEDEGQGSPPCPVGSVRLRLASGEETLLRTLPLTSGGVR